MQVQTVRKEVKRIAVYTLNIQAFFIYPLRADFRVKYLKIEFVTYSNKNPFFIPRPFFSAV
jgi:hypothetical protein